jgi:hypothetical protein
MSEDEGLVERVAQAVYDAPTTDGDAVGDWIYESHRIDDGGPRALDQTRAVCADAARAAIAAVRAWDAEHTIPSDATLSAIAEAVSQNASALEVWEIATRATQSGDAPEYAPQVVACPKCNAKGVAFICDRRGCPVNGGAAHE